MHRPSARDLAIEHAFRDAADHVERSSDGGWRLVIGAGGARTILHARIVDDDWLAAGVLHAWSARQWWPLLQLNAALDGCVRLTSAPGGGLEVRGEILTADDDRGVFTEDRPCLRERVAGMCADVMSAGRRLVDALAEESKPSLSTPSDPDVLLRICRDAGWEVSALGPDRVQATLDTRSALSRATLSMEAGGRLRAVAPLTTVTTLSPESQGAIARVLLTATTQLRMVKGLAIREDGGEIAGLSFAGEREPATATTVDCALTTLSVACRAVELEVQALQNVDLARGYLTIRGFHPADFVSPPLSEQEDMPCLQLP